jgi:hypothetical protein
LANWRFAELSGIIGPRASARAIVVLIAVITVEFLTEPSIIVVRTIAPAVLRGISAVLALWMAAIFTGVSLITNAGGVIFAHIAEVAVGIFAEKSRVLVRTIAIAVFIGSAAILTLRHGAVLTRVVFVTGARVVLVRVSLPAIGRLAELSPPVGGAYAMAIVS